MLKKLLANKKLLAVIVIVVGIVIAVVINQDSKETGKSGVSIETGKDKGEAQENDDKQDEPYNGTGLEIMDEIDGTVDSVDGSGDWDGTSDDSNKKEQDNKTNDTQSDDTKKEDSNDDDDELNDDIIVDDKVWTEPS